MLLWLYLYNSIHFIHCIKIILNYRWIIFLLCVFFIFWIFCKWHLITLQCSIVIQKSPFCQMAVVCSLCRYIRVKTEQWPGGWLSPLTAPKNTKQSDLLGGRAMDKVTIPAPRHKWLPIDNLPKSLPRELFRIFLTLHLVSSYHPFIHLKSFDLHTGL